MPDDKKYQVSRRKALLGLGTIGVAGAAAGMGTSALFQDTETFENNSITAGTLNLSVTGTIPAANDEFVNADGSSGFDYNVTADGEVASGISLMDIKPGDWVILCYDISVLENPGCLSLGVPEESTANDENSVIEPEAADADEDNALAPGADIDGEGELAQELRVSVWGGFTDDDTSTTASSADPPTDLLSDPIVPATRLVDLWDALAGSPTLTGGVNEFEIYVLFELPVNHANEIMTDSVEWDFVFEAEQSRNNDCGPDELDVPAYE